MKKILEVILMVVFIFITHNAWVYTHANTPSTISIKPVSSKITIWEAFTEILKGKNSEIPKSYKYIQLNFKNIVYWTPYYNSLQKLVYLNIIPNKNITLLSHKKIRAQSFYRLAHKVLWYDIKWIKNITWRYATTYDIHNIRKFIALKKEIKVDSIFNQAHNTIKQKNKKNIPKLIITHTDNFQLKETIGNEKLYAKTSQKYKIFSDVYDTILKSHYDKSEITSAELIDWATKWLAKATGDKFTSYFPPTENKEFMENLDWEFEWIGSYVEMVTPGILSIVTPISGSPSEKAWIKWWDIVVSVDGKKIEESHSLREVISWIKWPKGSSVVLTIKRWKKILNIPVIRNTIIIKTVEHKKIDSKTYYIKLVSFWDDIAKDFEEALYAVKKNKKTKKIIIDLRNNPGGYLDEVSKMLGHFIPKGETTVLVKYIKWEKKYISKWGNIINPYKYRIIILQNEGSASASEIMAGSIKDYLPKTTIIGTKSYGKGSVQTIKSYNDWSSFKYTIAKWFTWKTFTWIDWVWVPADTVLEFDFEQYKKTKYDNQLEKAKQIK